MTLPARDLDSVFELEVTEADRQMQRRLGAASRSWLLVDWRTLDKLMPPGALARRPIARDEWAPFSLVE